MRTYKKTAVMLAAAILLTTAVGCGNSKTGGKQQQTTIAPDLTEKKTEAVINAGKLVGRNERYEMALPDETWKIEQQKEDYVTLTSGKNQLTVQYMTGDEADDLDFYYAAGEYDADREDAEDYDKYDLTYFKDCSINGDMDGFISVLSAKDGSADVKGYAAFGFPNTMDSYVVYTVPFELTEVNDTTVESVVRAVESFTTLRSAAGVLNPGEESGDNRVTLDSANKYEDAAGRFELTLPEGEWAAEESKEGIVTLTNNGQKFTISVAEGEEAVNTVIPSSYPEWEENLAPQSESEGDTHTVPYFSINPAQENCMYMVEFYDEYVEDAKYIMERRMRKNGVVYIVRAEYTKDAAEADVEQGMLAVESFVALK